MNKEYFVRTYYRLDAVKTGELIKQLFAKYGLTNSDIHPADNFMESYLEKGVEPEDAKKIIRLRAAFHEYKFSPKDDVVPTYPYADWSTSQPKSNEFTIEIRKVGSKQTAMRAVQRFNELNTPNYIK